LKSHKKEFERFRRFVSDFPGLGGLHPFGQRLAVEVRRAAVTRLDPAPWFRALPYREGVGPEYLLPADPRRIALSAGRFNYAGQLGYYIADSPESAAAEAVKGSGTVAWLYDRDANLTDSDVAARMSIPLEEAQRLLKNRIECEDTVLIGVVRVLRPLRVLNICGRLFGARDLHSRILEALVNLGSLREPAGPYDRSCPQHRVPQFIADVVRSRGLDGILYDSSQELPGNPESYGRNLVVFNPPAGTVAGASEPPVRYRWSGVSSIPDLALMDFTLARLSEWPQGGKD
jgi:hypothetical protein